jgi:hypothetical protein
MTADDIAAARALQEQSAADRSAGGRIDVMHGDADSAPLADGLNAPPRSVEIIQPPPSEDRGFKEPLPPASKGDLDRASIVNRMREQRQADHEEALAEGDQIRRDAGIDGGFSPDEPPPPLDPAPPPGQQNGKVRLKIRGTEIDVDPDMLLAMAQKAGAADSYLAEARAIRDQAKREAADMLEQASMKAELEALRDREIPTELDSALAEAQFGDPDQARRQLASSFDAAVRQQTQQDREKAELAKSQQTLTDWVTQNADISNDDFAMSSMQGRLFSEMREDLHRAGFDVSQLKSDDALANMHMRFRAGGHGVRALGEIFDKAAQDYRVWRGGAPARSVSRPNGARPPAPQPQPRQAEPRLEINVDRSQRRANIPTQARSSAPQRMPMIDEPTSGQMERRQSVAEAMQQQRRRARGAM